MSELIMLGRASIRSEWQWRQHAVCFLETSGAPELWTPDLQPRGVVRQELARMCARCPVRRKCAAHAVRSEAEGGFYAGVWVPERSGGGQCDLWHAAMNELRQVAADKVCDRAGLEVPA